MKNPIFLKSLVVGALALALLIPLSMVRELVAERQARAAEAVAGIAEGWGLRQVLGGPMLAIPYERHWTEVKREVVDGKPREARIERKESRVLRLPAASVDWIVGAELSEKARGLYKARLYGARLQAKGVLQVPATAAHEDGTSRYRWGTPRLELAVSDPRGIRAATVAAGAIDLAFAAGSSDGAGLHALLPDAKPGPLEFRVALDLAGSESLAIAPRGADTTVAMRADWPHPSFLGRFLPERHAITADGFSASWRISRLAAPGGEPLVVSFVEPAGLYQRLERAAKYGFLFVGLTFAAFFLLEALRRLAIHPVQYGLVGLALAMFFVLLTALSEHADFGAAYATAALACIALVTGYLVFVLKATAAMAFGAALSGVYAVLYLLLTAEDYSLLGGSLFLFGALAAAMAATRRVDWYALSRPAA